MAMYLVALAGSFSAAYLLIFALFRDIVTVGTGSHTALHANLYLFVKSLPHTVIQIFCFLP